MYIVTGASGWMGRTTLSYLRDELNVDLKNEVCCYSSQERMIELTDGDEIHSKDLREIVNFSGDVEGLFHFAFLTKDFVEKIGQAEYVNTNTSILNTLSDVLARTKYRWSVSVSSGAVFDKPGGSLTKDVGSNPYGFLKLKEEKLLLDAAQLSGATSVIGRLWGCTGSLMPVDRKYAISDFIYQGLTSDNIEVQANHVVWRRYMDGQDFIRILHRIAILGKSTTLDSAGDLIEVGELAEKIANKLGIEVSRKEKDITIQPDNYFPNDQVMRKYCEEFGIRLLGIDQQVEETLKGHRRQLKIT